MLVGRSEPRVDVRDDMLFERPNVAGAFGTIPFGLGGFGLARSLDLQTWWDGPFVVVFGLVGGLVVMGFAPPPRKEQLEGLMIRGRYKP